MSERPFSLGLCLFTDKYSQRQIKGFLNYMTKETTEENQERKAMYLARVSNLASMTENFDEIMKEASDKFDEQNKDA